MNKKPHKTPTPPPPDSSSGKKPKSAETSSPVKSPRPPDPVLERNTARLLSRATVHSLPTSRKKELAAGLHRQRTDELKETTATVETPAPETLLGTADDNMRRLLRTTTTYSLPTEKRRELAASVRDEIRRRGKDFRPARPTGKSTAGRPRRGLWSAAAIAAAALLAVTFVGLWSTLYSPGTQPAPASLLAKLDEGLKKARTAEDLAALRPLAARLTATVVADKTAGDEVFSLSGLHALLRTGVVEETRPADARFLLAMTKKALDKNNRPRTASAAGPEMNAVYAASKLNSAREALRRGEWRNVLALTENAQDLETIRLRLWALVLGDSPADEKDDPAGQLRKEWNSLFAKYDKHWNSFYGKHSTPLPESEWKAVISLHIAACLKVGLFDAAEKFAAEAFRQLEKADGRGKLVAADPEATAACLRFQTACIRLFHRARGRGALAAVAALREHHPNSPYTKYADRELVLLAEPLAAEEAEAETFITAVEPFAPPKNNRNVWKKTISPNGMVWQQTNLDPKATARAGKNILLFLAPEFEALDVRLQFSTPSAQSSPNIVYYERNLSNAAFSEREAGYMQPNLWYRFGGRVKRAANGFTFFAPKASEELLGRRKAENSPLTLLRTRLRGSTVGFGIQATGPAAFRDLRVIPWVPEKGRSHAPVAVLRAAAKKANTAADVRRLRPLLAWALADYLLAVNGTGPAPRPRLDTTLRDVRDFLVLATLFDDLTGEAGDAAEVLSPAELRFFTNTLAVPPTGRPLHSPKSAADFLRAGLWEKAFRLGRKDKSFPNRLRLWSRLLAGGLKDTTKTKTEVNALWAKAWREWLGAELKITSLGEDKLWVVAPEILTAAARTFLTAGPRGKFEQAAQRYINEFERDTAKVPPGAASALPPKIRRSSNAVKEYAAWLRFRLAARALLVHKNALVARSRLAELEHRHPRSFFTAAARKIILPRLRKP